MRRRVRLRDIQIPIPRTFGATSSSSFIPQNMGNQLRAYSPRDSTLGDGGPNFVATQ
ncbi:hypothetical protein OROHE_000934 [Orobanche hederae]